jgi:signal transduction histidine kinase/ligand-binding sensor domain-containing protein/AraC-like DNA-binding protein
MQFTRSIIIIIVFLALFFLPAKASSPKFYSINNIFGISMRETSSVCKDDNGFIWTSSKTGVLRITHDNHRLYHLPYESTNVISLQLIYQNSQLLACANNGQIFNYNPVFDRFELLINLSRVLNNKYLVVNTLLVDVHGACWVASSSGLYRYDLEQLTLIKDIQTEVYSIAWYDQDRLIIVRPEGIWLLNIHSFASECVYRNSSITPFSVPELYYDKENDKLWIGTMSNGLFSYDFGTRILSSILPLSFPKQPVLAIESNTDSTMLFGVDGQGVWELNRNGNKILNVYKENLDNPFSLRGNGVYDLYCDSDRRIWICTYSGGLSFYDQSSPLVSQIVHYTNVDNSLVNNDVNSIIEDRWGKLWFATNNGISCWDVANDRWESFYHNKQKQAQVFLSLCEDDQGRIWAGTYSSGVYVLDGFTGAELGHYPQDRNEDSMVSDFIIDIYKDTEGDIWLGGVNGELLCYLSRDNKFRSYSRQSINALGQLEPDKMLLGCIYGLSLLDKNTGEIEPLLLGSLIYDILTLGDDIWICTSGDGLIKYNYRSGNTETFTTQSGLPSNFINSVMYDEGFLWIGTENGMCRLDLSDNSVLTYDSIFSLSIPSFNRGSHCKLKSGQLAWGTNNGAVLFNPISIGVMSHSGKIYFNDLFFSGRSVRDIPSFELNTSVDNLSNIDLEYFQNTISLELLPIGINAHSKFSWKMEGFDSQWSTPSDSRTLTYTNIPSGNYTLMIRLYDSSLSQLITERSLNIRVQPPFWRTVWFRLLVLAFIAVMIIFSLLYYIHRFKHKHAEDKVRFFTNTAHDIRTSLTLIKAPVEELNRETHLSETGRHYLQLAIEQTRRLSLFVTQLMDFQKLDVGREQLSMAMTDVVRLVSGRKAMFEMFAKSKHIELRFSSNCQSYLTAIDETKIGKVIDNLISNAVKYSYAESCVEIELKCGTKEWSMKVKDRGVGISRKAQHSLFKEFYRGENVVNSKIVGSGIGLLLVKNYVSMHEGTIRCDSQENVGSVFEIVIPYKEVTEREQAASILSVTDKEPYLLDNPVLPSQDTDDNSHKVLKLLIVEDNDELRNFLHRALYRHFMVILAENGEKAWEIVSRQMPDLVVSDVMMPKMDGFELCRTMKSTFETSHIPVILLTALTGNSEQLYGLGLGADDYLTKPFHMELLRQKIKTILHNREIIREKAYKLINSDRTGPVLQNEHNDKFVKKMMEVVQSNISNPAFDKDLFARSMNVSPSLLYKKIKALTGLSPTNLTRVVRLNYSMELLQTTRYSVTEVSELCGFTSLGYFSTVFRKHFGKSPTEILEY